MDDHPFAIPDLTDVAHRCQSTLPSEAQKLLKDGLSIFHLNARSLHQSYPEIVALIKKNNFSAHFIQITESWLDPNLLSGYQLPGYEILHSIPTNSSYLGKGCALYIRNDIAPFCKKVNDLCAEEIEFQSIFVQVTYPSKPIFLVGVTYRSPSYPFHLFQPYLESTLCSINNLHRPCYWGGDWNLNLFQYNSRADVKAFLDCLNSFGFFPTITIPTRISTSPPYSETLIDNIFTNTLSSILQSCTVCCGIADHLAVLCTTNILNLRSGEHVNVPVMKKFNFARIEELKANVAAKLNTFHEIRDPEHACEMLSSTIQTEVEFLSFTSTHRKTSPIQPWVTSAILRSINTRNKLLKQFLKQRNSENELKFKRYRNVLRLTMRHAKTRYFQNQFTKYANNPRLLWENLLQAINKRKEKRKPASSYEINGEFITDSRLIAESFNEYYSNVAPNLDASLGPSNVDPLSYLQDVRTHETMMFSPVTEQEIFAIVMSLKETGAGHDGISAKLLKHVLPAIIHDVTHFINLCITHHTFPSLLKEAVITPVFKGGHQTEFSSYRPISVLPVFSKILEIVMYNQLLSFISENDIIFDYQFGFRAGHSTYMPISIFHDFITDNLTRGQKTAGIFLDLARAFDTVNLNILLQKLDMYGISGDALCLLTSYLNKRKHRVKFNGIVSDARDITCGVPQGSVLGPLLFLLYINDLEKACSVSKCLLFADDTAIFYSAPTMEALQSKINQSFPKIVVWLQSNRLSLSVPKTFYQIYTTSEDVHGLTIQLGNAEIKRSDTVKYLGVLVDENLKFKSHISKISGIVSRHVGILGRARYLLNKNLLLMLYNALILPYLTYCVCIWGSNYQSTLHPIIVAQKRAIRVIAGVPPRTHTTPLFQDLKILKFDDLVHYQILNILHDFLNGRLPTVIADKFVLHAQLRPTRTSKHFSEQSVSETGDITPNYRMFNYRKFSLFCQGPLVWNNIIARNIVDIKNVPLSKSFFKKVVRKLFIDNYK